MPILAISPAISQCENDDPPPALTLATPTRRHLRQLWAAMAAEDAFANYSDLFPRSADQARAALHRGTMRLWTVHGRGAVVGAWWVHDRGHDAAGLYGWLGCYFRVGHRGAAACATFPLLHALLAAHGLHRLFVAVRRGHRAGMHFAARCGFRRVGIYAQLTVFQGQFDSAVLYVREASDIPHVWAAAANRALAVKVLVAMQKGGSDEAPGR